MASYVSVNVDVHVDDIIGEIEDNDLVEELENRGYYVSKRDGDPYVIDKDDWIMLEDIISKLPYNWKIEELRRKIVNQRTI